MFSKIRGKTKFQNDWREDFSWVRPVEGNIHAAKCIFCKSEIAVDTMGRRALTSHAQGKKHTSHCQQAAKSTRIVDFLPKSRPAADSLSIGNTSSSVASPYGVPSTSAISSSSSVALPYGVPSISAISSSNASSEPLCLSCNSVISTSSTRSPPKKTTRNVMDIYMSKENVTRAEILWCLYSVVFHGSLRAAGSAISLFKIMFPQCDIAQGMQLQKSKISYTIVHGLGPYFKKMLNKNLKNCKYFVVGYDESLNKIAQRQQMDINLRFWDNDRGEVATRYYTSVFLEHTTAEDLLQALKTALADMDLKKMLQVSMDGPNVNFKMIRLWKDELNKDPDDPKLVDIGSCGLHTVHCAFKNGIKATGWAVISFLRAIYNLFKDVPSRRGDFISITGTKLFPLKFCSVRWLENVDVADRALKILPYLEKYVNTVKGTKKEPQCYSFTVIENNIKCKLLKPQLAFFQSLSENVAPFLQEFQSDAPLAPFLFGALSTLLSTTMERIVKKEVFDQTLLKDIDFDKKDNFKPAKHVILGFGTKNALRKCQDLTQKDILYFKDECKTCLKLFARKLLERSPLNYPLTKALSCLDPQLIASSRGGEKELSSALNILVNSNRMSGFTADQIARQYKTLISKPHILDAMKSYSRREQKLDLFWMSLLKINDNEWDELSEFVKMMLIISHGNANLERGFSINKECLVANQKEMSLIAQRHVIEAVNILGGVEKVDITKEMIQAARNARAKYQESLEEQRKKDENLKRMADEKKRSAELVKELQAKKRKLIEETEREVYLIQEQVESLTQNK